MTEAKIIPFPKLHPQDNEQERLRRALENLKSALDDQKRALAEWKFALAELGIGVAGLGHALGSYYNALGGVGEKLASLRTETAILQDWADTTISSEPPAASARDAGAHAAR